MFYGCNRLNYWFGAELHNQRKYTVALIGEKKIIFYSYDHIQCKRSWPRDENNELS